MADYIHPITLQAAVEVACNLRPDDRREVVEGHGHDPMDIVPSAIYSGFCVSFTAPNGKTAGLAGIEEDNSVWMLCTPAIHDHPIWFARACKRFIDAREEPILWNWVDKRNTVHIKLLRFLGFKFLREENFGPNNLPFINFCRVRTY